MTVDPIAARRASIRNLLDRAGRGVLNVSEAELLRQQVEAELRVADGEVKRHVTPNLEAAERAQQEIDRLREQIHEERERMRTSFREQDAENARLRERLKDAERRIANLQSSYTTLTKMSLGFSERAIENGQRAEQAEELLRVAHETSNASETERARAVRRAEQAEAAIARVVALADQWQRTDQLGAVIGFGDAAASVRAALDEPKEPTS